MSPDPGAPDAPQDITFGLFDWIDAAPGRTPGEVYQSRLRLLTEADRGGFSVYHLAEHHGTPLGLAPSPALFLAAAAQATERIRLAPTTFIVPLYDPLRLVQEIGMLDQLSGGGLGGGGGKGPPPGPGGGGGRGRAAGAGAPGAPPAAVVPHVQPRLDPAAGGAGLQRDLRL